MLFRSCSKLFYARFLIVSSACLYSLLMSINEESFCPYCRLSRVIFLLLSAYYLYVIFSSVKVPWVFEAFLLFCTIVITFWGALAEIHWIPDFMSLCSDVSYACQISEIRIISLKTLTFLLAIFVSGLFYVDLNRGS